MPAVGQAAASTSWQLCAVSGVRADEGMGALSGAAVGWAPTAASAASRSSAPAATRRFFIRRGLDARARGAETRPNREVDLLVDKMVGGASWRASSGGRRKAAAELLADCEAWAKERREAVKWSERARGPDGLEWALEAAGDLVSAMLCVGTWDPPHLRHLEDPATARAERARRQQEAWVARAASVRARKLDLFPSGCFGTSKV
mmetsp:Transcript_66272/g.209516  ORF Transcript_66272/g.209516 Transcript_66272/m.209516 type:complete len:204 (-) Transcript_66272:66-677(-)